MERNDPDTTGLSDADIIEIRDILLVWGKEHYHNFPWRRPEHLWHGLIAEILLQRTRANNVLPVYEAFVRNFPVPQSLALASQDDIERVIYPLGLRWRAPLLKKLGEKLVQTDGKLPETMEGLLELPGVGVYIAAAWLGFHGKGRSVIIDANVVRWICKIVDRPMDGETRRKRWLIELAERLTPDGSTKEYNYAVLDFSMDICTVTPKCEQCPLGPKFCSYNRRQLSEALEGDPV